MSKKVNGYRHSKCRKGEHDFGDKVVVEKRLHPRRLPSGVAPMEMQICESEGCPVTRVFIDGILQ